MSTLRPSHQTSRVVESVVELSMQPCAAFWAEACGWVPGTGHCRNRDCAEACLFEAQRAAEARHVERRRRSRRVQILRRDLS